jgi:hypothetical protein
VSLSSLSPVKSMKKNFVLIEESRLQHLISLNDALQKEQSKLNKQCANIVTSSSSATGLFASTSASSSTSSNPFQSDFSYPLSIPLPAVRFAIHSLCEEQMSKVRKELITLNQQWTSFCRVNHYHKNHLFLKNSYVDCAPYAQKALKLRLVKEATQTWQLRKERDTMSYEDDISFLTSLYYDALYRQRDYERYYILAIRYGNMNEEQFNLDDFPGKRYYKRVTKATIMIQHAWDRYWAVMKLRRYRAARMIQKYWRCFHVYRKIHPIIKLRLKIGKKTYYIFCFSRWKEYNSIVKKIKNAITFQLSNTQQICFNAWSSYIKEQRRDREKVLERFSRRFRNLALYHTYSYWKLYVTTNKALKLKLRRLFAFPHFDIWVEYTRWSKHVKYVNKAVVRIQCLLRKVKAKHIVKKRFLSREKIFHLGLVWISKILTMKCRLQQLSKEFVEWKPMELKRRQQKLNDSEKSRLQKKQLYLSDKEKNAFKELKKHLNSSNGIDQLKYMVEEQQQQGNLNEKEEDVEKKEIKALSNSAPLSPLFLSQLPSPATGTALKSGAFSGLSSPIGSADGGGMLSRQESIGADFANITAAIETPGAATASNDNDDTIAGGGGFLSWLPFFGRSVSPVKGRKSMSPSIKETKAATLGNRRASVKGSKKQVKDEYHKQLDLMVKRLKRECSKTIRLIEGFQYDIKYPPLIRCYHHGCGQCFTSEDLYHRHIINADSTTSPHKEEKEMEIERRKAAFEAMLKDRKKEMDRQLELSCNGVVDELQGKELTLRQEKLTFLSRFSYLHYQSTYFHLYLRNIKGIESYRNYLVSLYGLSGMVNLLDCYLSLQEWKKFTIYQPQFYTKAMSIYETYLQDESSIRYLNLFSYISSLLLNTSSASSYQPFMNGIHDMLSTLAMMKEDEINSFPGFYHEVTKKLTTIQGFLGSKPSKFKEWTTKKLLFPTIFQDLEFLLFSLLYSSFCSSFSSTTSSTSSSFLFSNEYFFYLKTVEKELQQKEDSLFNDYKVYRLTMISSWSISFKQYEQLISEKASKVTDDVTTLLIDEIYKPIEKKAVRERKVVKSYHEQWKYEENDLVSDEAIHFVADDTAEFIFIFYVNSLINAMWEVPDYRKGMLQYSGLAKFKLKKKNDIIANYEAMMSNKEKLQENKEWFNTFFATTLAIEKALIPKEQITWRPSSTYSSKKRSISFISERRGSSSSSNSQLQAVITIQRIVRGVLGRKKARKQFAKTFKKLYDSSSQAHYYCNTVTQESSWTPPSLFKRLYPKADW